MKKASHSFEKASKDENKKKELENFLTQENFPI